MAPTSSLSAYPRKKSCAFLQRLALMVGVGLLLVTLLNQLGIVETLELAIYDLRFRMRGARLADAPVVIVAINDESFNALDRNLRTWPRAEYARLIDDIAAGGPAVIGVDVAWTHAGTGTGGDEVLAQSLRRASPVILAGLIEHQEDVGYEYDRYAAPVEILAGAADGVGLVNVALDADGVFRRVVLHRLHNDVWYPAFGYAVAQAYGQLPASTGAGRSPELLINFRGGPNTFPTVSMYQVLNGEVPAEVFAGQIVLIGFTTILEQDLHITPFDWAGLTPGVEVHANVVATLLNNDPIRRVPAWLSICLNLIVVALTVVAFWRFRPVQATVAVGGGAFLYLAITYLLNKLGNVDAETCFGLAETGLGRQKRQQVGASIPSATDGDYLPLNIEMMRYNVPPICAGRSLAASRLAGGPGCHDSCWRPGGASAY